MSSSNNSHLLGRNGVGEEAGCGVGDDDRVLDMEAAERGIDMRRLDAEHHPRFERRPVRRVDQWLLVQPDAKTVPEVRLPRLDPQPRIRRLANPIDLGGNNAGRQTSIIAHSISRRAS